MPIETVLMVPNLMDLDEQREYASLIDPPMVMHEENGGSTYAFYLENGERALTLSRPKRIENRGDIQRALGQPEPIPKDVQFWIEGIVPTEPYQPGLTLLYTFEAALGGLAVARGIDS